MVRGQTVLGDNTLFFPNFEGSYYLCPYFLREWNRNSFFQGQSRLISFKSNLTWLRVYEAYIFSIPEN